MISSLAGKFRIEGLKISSGDISMLADPKHAKHLPCCTVSVRGLKKLDCIMNKLESLDMRQIRPWFMWSYISTGSLLIIIELRVWWTVRTYALDINGLGPSLFQRSSVHCWDFRP